MTDDEINKLLIPLGGFIVAVIALSVNYYNGRRQVKIGKIEEISELILLLQDNYQKFYLAYQYLQEIRTEEGYYAIPEEIRASNLARIEELIPQKDDYLKKLARLEVLANSYLTKNRKLKIKVLTYANMYKHLSTAIFHKVLTLAEQNYPLGFPIYQNLQDYTYSIQKKLIKQMGLGYKNLSHRKRIAYREKQFLIDVGLLFEKKL